jgi:tetratricopeptide (TPR) repeat protein
VYLAEAGPVAAADAREAVALGHVYRRAGREEAARDAFERAVSMNGDPMALADALRALALAERRARRHDEAARRWNDVLAVPGCPAQIVREATEALAVHHEHRARDLDAAREYALRSLGEGSRPAWTTAARYRLARIERKMGLRN